MINFIIKKKIYKVSDRISELSPIINAAKTDTFVLMDISVQLINIVIKFINAHEKVDPILVKDKKNIFDLNKNFKEFMKNNKLKDPYFIYYWIKNDILKSKTDDFLDIVDISMLKKVKKFGDTFQILSITEACNNTLCPLMKNRSLSEIKRLGISMIKLDNNIIMPVL